jgi:protein involved in polysaccharide export with SLBB domain
MTGQIERPPGNPPARGAICEWFTQTVPRAWIIREKERRFLVNTDSSDAAPFSPSCWRLLLRWTGLSLAFLLFFGLSGPTGASDNGYRLGPQDKVRVKVYEWRPSRDQIFEWSALNDEFTISAAGTLSLPLAGEILAAGLTPGELAKRIAAELQNAMDLGRRPDTSVEVAEFRPFYVVGHVDRPGAFPYRPALTVLQALSIAGGLRRSNEQGLLRIERDAIVAKGDLDLFRHNVNSLLTRRARLEAELKQAETIDFPRELTGRRDEPLIILMMRQEQQIFDTRREAFRTQLHALEQLTSYFEKEVGQLNAQLETEDRQIQLVKKELDGVSVLVSKGLSVAPRQLSLERTLAQIEGDRLRVGTSLLKARQEISKTEITILELKNKRTNDAAVELRETQAKLDELARKAATSEQLLYEAEVMVPQLVSRLTRSRRIEPVYTIVRQSGGGTVEMSASEVTTVEPGDTIKVELPESIGSAESESLIVPTAASRLPYVRAERPNNEPR